jgi:hypothetical protein
MLLSSLLAILAVLLLMTSMMMLLSLLLLPSLIQHSCFCWHPFCVGGPVVAFISVVSCVPAVVNGHDIAVILALSCC